MSPRERERCIRSTFAFARCSGGPLPNSVSGSCLHPHPPSTGFCSCGLAQGGSRVASKVPIDDDRPARTRGRASRSRKDALRLATRNVVFRFRHPATHRRPFASHCATVRRERTKCPGAAGLVARTDPFRVARHRVELVRAPTLHPPCALFTFRRSSSPPSPSRRRRKSVLATMSPSPDSLTDRNRSTTRSSRPTHPRRAALRQGALRRC